MSVAMPFRSNTRGSSICCRLKASNWRVSVAARSPARRICSRSAPTSLWPADLCQGQFGIADDGSEEVIEVVGDAHRPACPRLHFLGLAELLFHLSLLGDVTENVQDGGHAPTSTNDRGSHQDGALSALLITQLELVVSKEPVLIEDTAEPTAVLDIDVAVSIVGFQHVLSRGVPCHFDSRLVDVEQLPLGGVDNDRVRGALEQGSVELVGVPRSRALSASPR